VADRKPNKARFIDPAPYIPYWAIRQASSSETREFTAANVQQAISVNSTETTRQYVIAGASAAYVNDA
jgi:hypothetical protein